jgi:RHS repeat-associated protein
VGLSGGATATFAYDALARRRSKTAAGLTTQFLYDGENLVQEESSGGTPTANLLTGLGIDQTFTRTDASGMSTFLVDVLGSTLELADASGTLQTHYTFEPFGTTTTSGASTTSALQFTGRENDGTGLYFNRARFYSGSLQRWISEDPIEFAGGDINLFAYVLNAPTRYNDPLGLVVVRFPRGTFPACEKLGTRKEPSFWDRLKCDLELGQALPMPAAMFLPGEVQGLRQLFGRRLEGVTKLLERLRAGERVPLPEGVTPETLKKYADVAERAIQQGKDASGVQQGRQEAIDLLLKQLGIQ